MAGGLAVLIVVAAAGTVVLALHARAAAEAALAQLRAGLPDGVTLSWSGFEAGLTGRDIVLDGIDLVARDGAGTRALKVGRLALSGIAAGPEGVAGAAIRVARLTMTDVSARLPDRAGGAIRVEAVGLDLLAPDVPALLALALGRGTSDLSRAATFEGAAVSGLMVEERPGTRLAVTALALGRTVDGLVQRLDFGPTVLAGADARTRVEVVRLDYFDLKPLLGLPPGAPWTAAALALAAGPAAPAEGDD